MQSEIAEDELVDYECEDSELGISSRGGRTMQTSKAKSSTKKTPRGRAASAAKKETKSSAKPSARKGGRRGKMAN